MTIQLEADTLRSVRILAAKRDTSISKLIAEQIEWLVRTDDAYDKVSREAVDELRRGFHLGGGDLPERSDLYERG